MERKTKVLLGVTSRRPQSLPFSPRMQRTATGLSASLGSPTSSPDSPGSSPQEVSGSSSQSVTQ